MGNKGEVTPLRHHRLSQQGASGIERVEAYGIDVSLLKLTLTWTPKS